MLGKPQHMYQCLPPDSSCNCRSCSLNDHVAAAMVHFLSQHRLRWSLRPKKGIKAIDFY